jgi:rhodanese-related sulfurtransferase
LGLSGVARAVSPEALKQRLSAGEKITIVDVRPTVLFKSGHIPDAINIPASLVPGKQLPPLGHVVVYDEGLGHDTARAAAAALGAKSGITAEALEGGLAAWEQSQSLTTKPAGMKPEELPMISYAQLKQTDMSDVVLVDLRKKRDANAPKIADSAAALPLTDLAAEFPNARISRSAYSAVPAARTMASSKSPLLVLIDNGDGAAEREARALKANGIKRFVILLGGEEMIARKGQPGLQRAGSTVIMRKPPGLAGTNTNK